MPWLRRHAAWAWSAVLIVILCLIVAIRVGSSPPARPSAIPAAESRGVVAGDSSDLAATAQRMRTILEEMARIREKLASAQADLSMRRERIATLEEMLAADSLTECPPFLRDETTVRALQKIIRDARESEGPMVPAESRLTTAATVARERLRSRLEGMKDQLRQEAGTLEAQAEALRQHLRLKSDELDDLQRQVQKQLHSGVGPRRTGAAQAHPARTTFTNNIQELVCITENPCYNSTARPIRVWRKSSRRAPRNRLS